MKTILMFLIISAINLFPVLYFGLMIYFLLSKNDKLKKIGKIMLGIIITLIILIISLFVVACTGIFSSMY